MPSTAYRIFNKYTVAEVQSMADIFTNENLGRGPKTNFGVLRGGLILLVSGWQTFCEEISKEAVNAVANAKNISFDDLSNNTRSAILEYAYTEPYMRSVIPKKIANTNIAKLPDDGWKELAVEMVNEFIDDFNTPRFRSKHRQAKTGKRTKEDNRNVRRKRNLKNLFNMYLESGVDRKLSKLTGNQNISFEIDKIITLRGSVAHKAWPYASDKFFASDLEHFLQIIVSACAALDCIIYTEFRSMYGITPWNMNSTVSSKLPGYKQN